MPELALGVADGEEASATYDELPSFRGRWRWRWLTRAVRLRCQASRFYAFSIRGRRRRGVNRLFGHVFLLRAVRRFGANKFYHFYFLCGNNDSNNTLSQNTFVFH